MDELLVDLSLPPRERWVFFKQSRRAASALLDIYKRDLGLVSPQASFLVELGQGLLPAVLVEEMTGIAERTELSLQDVLLGNLYYDALKVAWGCTAFAVNSGGRPVHARNLDWWTENDALAKFSLVTRFRNGPAGDFITIGWPGFVGALSGVAPGRFSISLNAVLSDDAPEMALPVVALLRLVLEQEASFASAVERLCQTKIASDAILLVAGTRLNEMVVIERTPTHYAVRHPGDEGAVRATNNYVSLPQATERETGNLQLTSCDRFDRIGDLLKRPPSDLDECLRYLSDDRVKMGITVQQMAFCATTGDYRLSIPSS